MTNERIINAVEEFMADMKQQVLFELKQDPEWMETTLQAENVKEWANNLIQTEVTGIVENADNIQQLEETVKELESKIEELESSNFDAFQENANKRIKVLEEQETSEIQVAAMLEQAFSAAIDAHYHLKN
jgi:TolA-binding protein